MTRLNRTGNWQTPVLLVLVPAILGVGYVVARATHATPSKPQFATTPAPAALPTTGGTLYNAKHLAAELGCPTATILAGTGLADSAETADCGDYTVYVFGAPQGRDAFLHASRAFGGYYAAGQVNGTYFELQAHSDASLEAGARKTGAVLS